MSVQTVPPSGMGRRSQKCSSLDVKGSAGGVKVGCGVVVSVGGVSGVALSRSWAIVVAAAWVAVAFPALTWVGSAKAKDGSGVAVESLMMMAGGLMGVGEAVGEGSGTAVANPPSSDPKLTTAAASAWQLANKKRMEIRKNNFPTSNLPAFFL